MQALQWANTALRGLMETAIVAGFGVWGYQFGGGTGTRIALMILVPLAGFGFWSLIDFHQAGTLAEPLRLVEELAISGLAAAAWYASGWSAVCWWLVALSLVHHVLVYTLGGALLKQ